MKDPKGCNLPSGREAAEQEGLRQRNDAPQVQLRLVRGPSGV